MRASATVEAYAAGIPRARRQLWRPHWNAQAAVLRAIAVVIVVVGIVAVPSFATASNVRGLLSAVSLVGIGAVGMAGITIGGNFFMLSMGATVAVATISFASFLQYGTAAAVALTVVLGAGIGLAQGAVVGRWRANPIITTIAASSIILGAGQLYSHGLTIVGKGDASALGQGHILAVVPYQALFFFAVAIVCQFFLQWTRLGRELRLTGSNYRAAVVAGIRVRWVTTISYVLAGACAALAGALLASQSAEGNLQLGAGFDFDVISAVLVGGVAIQGGRGSVFDAAFGAAFIGLIGNVLLLGGFSYQTQLVFKGLVVLLTISAGAAIRQWKS